MSMITITPIVVPPRAPVHQPWTTVVPEPSRKNKKRSREDEDGPLRDSKRPRTCPPLADALACLNTDMWRTEERSYSSPCSSTDTASHSDDDDSLEKTGDYLEESVTDDASDGWSAPTGPAQVGGIEGFKFASEDDRLAFVLSLPDMGYEPSEGVLSLSTSNIPASGSTLPPPAPMPVFAVDQELPVHYIPPPVQFPHVIKGQHTIDTEDLRRNIAQALWWQRHYATEPCTSLPAYEREQPPRKLLGTPPRSIHGRTKLEPPASAYKYALCSDDSTSQVTRPGDDRYTYSASELFGPDADTVKVAKCEPIRPRASVDLCELTTLEHTVRHKADTAAEPSATIKMRADPFAVDFWKASVNEVVDKARAAQREEDAARLEAELKAFFENAADDDEDGDDFEAVEIPDAELEAEADVSREYECVDAVSDSSSEESESEEGEDVFDYDQWVADYQAA